MDALEKPKFKDFNRKTRKFVNKTINMYMKEDIVRIPEYVNKRKLKIMLRNELIDSIYDLDMHGYSYKNFDCELYFEQKPLYGFILTSEEDTFYSSYLIPARIVKDVVNTWNFHKNIIKN